MKKWIAPAVAELSIEETANGLLPAYVETIVLWDKKECERPGTGEDTDDEEIVESFS